MKTLRKIGCFALSLFLIASISSCDNTQNEDVKLEGLWFILTDEFKELLLIDEDNKLISMGSDDEDIWMGIKGEIILDGNKISMIFEDDDNTFGTFKLKDDQLKIYVDGEEYTYTKLKESFSMLGEWAPEEDVLCFVTPIKDVIELPSGSTADGQEIPAAIPTAQLTGDFVKMAVANYLGNVKFRDDTFEYTMRVGENSTDCTKNYAIAHNMICVFSEDNSTEQMIRIFQNRAGDKAFLLLTKANMADMFVAWGHQLRQDNITEGDEDGLYAFRRSFMEAFENYAVLITLSK